MSKSCCMNWIFGKCRRWRLESLHPSSPLILRSKLAIEIPPTIPLVSVISKPPSLTPDQVYSTIYMFTVPSSLPLHSYQSRPKGHSGVDTESTTHPKSVNVSAPFTEAVLWYPGRTTVPFLLDNPWRRLRGSKGNLTLCFIRSNNV